MKLSYKIFLSACVVLLLNSIAVAKTTVKPEWEQDGCDIVKEDLKLSPEKLFDEFIQRDTDGEFLKTSPWLNKAVQCPGYMGGPDSFYIISDSKTKTLGSKNSFQVSYVVEGVVASKKIDDKYYSVFTPERKDVKEEYSVTKTPWGWKLSTPWSVSRVSVKKAFDWVEKENQPFDQKSKDLILKIKAVPGQ